MEEKHTYFAYREGIDPSLLRFGNIHFDYAMPKTKVPFIHPPRRYVPYEIYSRLQRADAGLSEKDLEEWTTHDSRPYAYLLSQHGRECTVGGGLQDTVEVDFSHYATGFTVVAGKNASKQEIN